MIAAILAVIATIACLLTGQQWQVMTVHSVPAVCEITVSHGQEYANNCFTL